MNRHAPEVWSLGVLEVRDLTKRYGANLAVDGLSFKAQPGRVLGFLGPNGAGKTTTLRMLLGLTLPTSGDAVVDSLPVPPARATRSRSWAPCSRARSSIRGARAATTCACSPPPRGLPGSRVDEVLRLVELEGAGDKRVKAYSLGMRQRLSLAGALLGDPRALVLDEPANGLDPQGIRWLRDFLRAQAARRPDRARVEPRAGRDGADGRRGRGDQPRPAGGAGLARRAHVGRRGAGVGAERRSGPAAGCSRPPGTA